MTILICWQLIESRCSCQSPNSFMKKKKWCFLWKCELKPSTDFLAASLCRQPGTIILTASKPCEAMMLSNNSLETPRGWNVSAGGLTWRRRKISEMADSGTKRKKADSVKWAESWSPYLVLTQVSFCDRKHSPLVSPLSVECEPAPSLSLSAPSAPGQLLTPSGGSSVAQSSGQITPRQYVNEQTNSCPCALVGVCRVFSPISELFKLQPCAWASKWNLSL